MLSSKEERKNDVYSLTGREEDVLNVLWNAEKGMTSSEIANAIEDTTINTIQCVTKNLLKRNLIKVDKIVYGGTVLARSYVPTITEAEFKQNKVVDRILRLERLGITPIDFIKRFIEMEHDKMEVEDLKEMKKFLLSFITEKK